MAYTAWTSKVQPRHPNLHACQQCYSFTSSRALVGRLLYTRSRCSLPTLPNCSVFRLLRICRHPGIGVLESYIRISALGVIDLSQWPNEHFHLIFDTIATVPNPNIPAYVCKSTAYTPPARSHESTPSIVGSGLQNCAMTRGRT